MRSTCFLIFHVGGYFFSNEGTFSSSHFSSGPNMCFTGASLNPHPSAESVWGQRRGSAGRPTFFFSRKGLSSDKYGESDLGYTIPMTPISPFQRRWVPYSLTLVRPERVARVVIPVNPQLELEHFVPRVIDFLPVWTVIWGVVCRPKLAVPYGRLLHQRASARTPHSAYTVEWMYTLVSIMKSALRRKVRRW
jgi:hypothetical protein